MTTLPSAPLFFCLAFAVTTSVGSGFVSIGYVSDERAAHLGLQVSSKKLKSGTIQVKVEFETKGELKAFREASGINRVELQIGELENPATVAPLREDRSTPGRLIVYFSIDRSQIDKTSVWILRPAEGIADVIRLKDFVNAG